MGVVSASFMSAPDLSSLTLAFQQHITQSLKSTFVGKDDIIDLMSLALIAGENLFLLGPPGTAKSALVNEMGKLLQCRSFDYLLTRFTEPNEIFGPFDIRKLREGDLVTNTEGMMPEADLVFLDELLNANSAILNSLLMALNERIFRRGRETRRLPALLFVGASNHLPQEDALRALFDRFLLRVYCGPVGEAQLPALLQAGWRLAARTEPATTELTADQVRWLQSQVQTVDLAPMQEAYLALIQKVRAAGLALSDRRVVKIQRVIAASALLSGRREARVSDLWVLRHVWDTDEQREWLAGIVDETLRKEAEHPQDHPRSRAGSAPDAESISLQLSSLANTELPPEVMKDHLTALGHRIEWVVETVAREALKERLAQLWQKLG
jgi:MoxR-like ATPase